MRPVSRLSHLRVKHLRLLELISAAGSLRGAAEALNLTQPAVTGMLQDLEGVAGSILVERDRRGARLTPAGEALRERLRLVSNELDVAVGQAALARPHLRIGALPLAMLRIIPDTVATLRAAETPTTLNVVQGTVAELGARLLAGELDCLIGRLDDGMMDAAVRNPVCVEPLMSVPLQLAAATSRDEVPSGLPALREAEWALPPRGSQTRSAFEQGFLQAGMMPPRAAVEIDSLFRIEVVARTDLLTIAPVVAISYYETLGLVRGLQFEWPVPLPPLSLIYREQSRALLSLNVFRAALMRNISSRIF